MKVAVIERKVFGGTCVNTGCIPTKTMVASAYAARVVARAAEYGVEVGPVGVERAIRSGELEREKQQALYVELLDDEVLTPTRINDAKAYRLLKHFVEALETPPGFDWAFVELDGESNRRSGWLASEQLGIVRRAFAACEAPS